MESFEAPSRADGRVEVTSLTALGRGDRKITVNIVILVHIPAKMRRKIISGVAFQIFFYKVPAKIL